MSARISMAAAHAARGAIERTPVARDDGRFANSIQGALERLLAAMPASSPAPRPAPAGQSFDGQAEAPTDDTTAAPTDETASSEADHDSGVFARPTPPLDAAVLAGLVAAGPASVPTLAPTVAAPASLRREGAAEAGGPTLATVTMSMAFAAPLAEAGHELASTAMSFAEADVAIEPDALEHAASKEAPRTSSNEAGAPNEAGASIEAATAHAASVVASRARAAAGEPFDASSSPSLGASPVEHAADHVSRAVAASSAPLHAHASSGREGVTSASASHVSPSSPDASDDHRGDLRVAGEVRAERHARRGQSERGASEGRHGEPDHGASAHPHAVDGTLPTGDAFAARLDAPAERSLSLPERAPVTIPGEVLVSPELQDLPAHAMHFASLDAQQGARVELMHPSLGRIDVDVRADGQHVDVALLSRSLGASIALRAAEQGLRGDLRARGSELRSYRVRTDAGRHASTPTATEEEENDE